MKSRILSIFVIIFAMFSMCKICAHAEKDHASNVADKISAGALIVDVRTPEEFASGHYKNAVNIPLDQIAERLKEFGAKDRPIVVYCRSGNRSAKAKALLFQHGFTDVTNGGGLSDMPK